MTETKPFSLTGSVSDFFTFVFSIFTLFFDSLFATKDEVRGQGCLTVLRIDAPKVLVLMRRAVPYHP